MSFETISSMYRFLNVSRYKLVQYQQVCCFRLARRDFRFELDQNFVKLYNPRSIQCLTRHLFINFPHISRQCLSRHLFISFSQASRKHINTVSRQFKNLTRKSPQYIHIARTRLNNLIFNKPLRSCLVLTLVPLQIVLWLGFVNIRNTVYNTILKYGRCEGVKSPFQTLDNNIVTPISGKNKTTPVSATISSIKDLFYTSLRAAYLLCVFSPLLMSYPLTYFSTRWFTLWLRFLFIAVEYSGATFVKLGQWASTRRDLFSKEFCDVFSGLHHRVRPHGWPHTVKTLKQAYGKNWQQILHIADLQEPLGSGCIAQVYKGYISAEFVPPTLLHLWQKNGGIKNVADDAKVSTLIQDSSSIDDNLIPVAIKVLHPKISETFHRDLKLMKVAARILTNLFPKLHWVNLNQCVEEFAVTMKKQLDMRYEFECLKRFTQDFQSCPNVKVPQPIPALVRHNVLVETFEEGISVSQVLKSTDHSVQFKEELASLGIDVLLQMVFVNNFVHADLHPGNLLVQSGKPMKKNDVVYDDVFDTMMVDVHTVEDSSLKLVLLDCGITASLLPEDRQKFQDVFTAVVMGEGETVAELFLTKSPINQCTDEEVFKKEMKELVAKGCQDLMSISKVKVAELMNGLFTVLSHHRIQLDSSFATIVLAIAMLEGLGRTLDPNMNLMDRARPVLLGSYLRK